MPDKTKIQWADATWNPILGCSKISPGCANCYAERMAKRLALIGTRGYWSVVDENGWTGQTAFVESELEKPARWKKPRNIFVCSMSDILHPSVKPEWINHIIAMMTHPMSGADHHTYMLLTKRIERIPVESYGRFRDWKNVWLGVTAENQDAWNERVTVLEQIPAAVRFVSIEPMLSEINMEDNINSGLIHWVICGGESGPGARPMNPDWVRSIRDQCKSAGVPFFFKQWSKKNSGHLLDGREHREFPNEKAVS